MKKRNRYLVVGVCLSVRGKGKFLGLVRTTSPRKNKSNMLDSGLELGMNKSY